MLHLTPVEIIAEMGLLSLLTVSFSLQSGQLFLRRFDEALKSS